MYTNLPRPKYKYIKINLNDKQITCINLKAKHWNRYTRDKNECVYFSVHFPTEKKGQNLTGSLFILNLLQVSC